MYVGLFVLILNGTRGSFFYCLLAFYSSNENSFHKRMYFIMPNYRENKYVVHVSLLSPSHNQFRQWKLINSFLINLDAFSLSFLTKISRRLPPVSDACRIKISPEKKKMNKIFTLKFYILYCLLPSIQLKGFVFSVDGPTLAH